MSIIKYPYYPNPDFDSLKVQGNNAIRSIVHGGKRERFAGNNSSGQSAPGYSKITPEAAIAGTRTTAQTFTRDADTWVVDALVGQYVYSYVNGDIDLGIWLKVTDNTATVITVAAAEGDLHALCDRVITCPWRPIQDEYAHGKGAGAFGGGVFDGESIWLVPLDSADLVKVNVSDGSMTSYNMAAHPDSFVGGVFDGENIWLVPFADDNIIKVDPSDGSMTAIAHGQGADAYQGAIFDGQYVWLCPWDSDNLTRLDPADGSLTQYDITGVDAGGDKFVGGCFDGKYIWLAPFDGPSIVRVDPSDGSMTTYAHGQGDNNMFKGIVFDGQNVWVVPNAAENIMKINPTNGQMTAIAHGQGATAFSGGHFDGESIWLIPENSDYIVKLNPEDNSMISYPHGKENAAFISAVFDGERMWLVPNNADDLIAFVPPRFGRPASNTSGPLNVGKAISVGSRTFSTEGPTDDVDVTDVSILWIDCAANDVTIGGFKGGRKNQILIIVKSCDAAFSAVLEHEEAGGDQDIHLHKGNDEELDTEYGGWTLICDGSDWYDISHAAHV